MTTIVDDIKDAVTASAKPAKTKKAKATKVTKKSRYNAEYAKAYREAKRYPVLITLDF